MSDALRDTLSLRESNMRRYFPDVLANAREFIAYADALEPELNLLIKKILRAALNTFVYDIDEQGAARWEDMLSLPRLPGAGIVRRRERILAQINLSLPYTIRTLQPMLDGAYGVGVVNAREEINAYELWLDVARSIPHKSTEARRFVRAIVPANLDIKVSSTEEKELSLYVGGVVVTSMRLEIHAANARSYDIDPCGLYVGGVVVQRKETVIRSD